MRDALRGPKEQRVDEAEDGRVGARADRERDQQDARQSRGTSK